MGCMKLARWALALTLALSAAAAPAQIYRWKDEKGRVHLGDTPPPEARNVEKRGAARAADTVAEPYALQLARKNAPVTLYSTPNCELCSQARALLNARGIPFKEVSVVTESQNQELLAAVGTNAVPSIIVGTTVQRGLEEATYHRILDAAGYPKLGELAPRDQKEPRPAPAQAEASAVEAPPSGPYAPGARRSAKRQER